jgi:two-component system, OmpR family, sensor histidine kinase KdpD
VPGVQDEPSRRPSPEALLEAVSREQRSRLKVFVGAAPGVGKTYAMLQAARERLRDGIDVVVGVVETHGRAETEALLNGLEVVPRQVVSYRGQALREMDLDAILERRPELVLVDELAHTNAPGCRHPKRWLDVEELLDAGMDVYTTVNIQHLESLNDVVAQITGVRVRETIPDRILDRADEVKLIDLSPEELIQRLQEGKVYIPEAAERALRNYFQPANLTALRELALRETAEHVDEQMQAHRRARAAPDTWAVTERVLVAVSGSALSERLVRAARRMAERRGAPWLAVFVEPPRFQDRPEAERDRVHRALRLAEQLGGEAVTVPGRSIAEDLLRVARERNASEIILGKPLRSRWRELWSGSVVDDVIRHSGAIDVRVITGDKPARGTPRSAPEVATRRSRRLRGYAFATAAIAAAAGAAAGLMAVLPLDDPSLVFLAAVLLSALVGGLGPSIFASLLGLLVYDFFFVEPRLTFTVTKPQDLLSLFVFLLVAVLTSNLTSRVRDQAEAARRRERRTATLYAFAKAIAAAASVEDLLRVIVEHVGREFGSRTAILLPEGGRLTARATHPPETELPEAERGTATWVWEHNHVAGRGTDTLPGGAWLHLPLSTVRGAVGVLALHEDDADDGLSLPKRQLLEAMAGQAAVAIERTRIDAVLEAQAKLRAVIESIEDGLVVVDHDGVVQHVNEVACAILGFTEREALGQRFERLGTDHAHYHRLRTAVSDFLAHPEREHEPVELALYLRGRDHYYMLRPTPLRAADGTHAGFILVLQDVTYLRDQEARREQLMATLSHELRTPLTSLRMAVNLLERTRPTLDPERAKLVEATREDVERLEDVAQRLLDVSRSRAMSIALERQHVHLGDVIARCARIFGLQARERGVALETSVPESDLLIAGDPTKILWALSNLIANGLRYTPRGGRVTIGASAEDGLVRISVSDTGPGIPPEQRERIFERFVQGQDGGEPGATGLGLAIVRDIVQAHGGRIFLDSELGKGSRFTLELPRG